MSNNYQREGHSNKDVTTAVVTAGRRAVGSGGAGGKETVTWE